MTNLAAQLADLQAAVNDRLAERTVQDPQFLSALVADPTETMAPLIAAALGDDADIGVIPMTINADTAAELLRVVDADDGDADVRGFGENDPIPYPDLGGGSGGSGGTVPVGGSGGGGGGSSSNVGDAAMKSISSVGGMGKTVVTLPAPTVMFQGKGAGMTGSIGMHNH